jgi:hypothetical protein
MGKLNWRKLLQDAGVVPFLVSAEGTCTGSVRMPTVCVVLPVTASCRLCSRVRCLQRNRGREVCGRRHVAAGTPSSDGAGSAHAAHHDTHAELSRVSGGGAAAADDAAAHSHERHHWCGVQRLAHLHEAAARKVVARGTLVLVLHALVAGWLR